MNANADFCDWQIYLHEKPKMTKVTQLTVAYLCCFT